MRLVIPCVHYAGELRETLPAWVRLVGNAPIVVATSIEDAETRAIAQQHGVLVWTTDAWTRRDPTCHVAARPNRSPKLKQWRGTRQDDTPTFNLALALDEAFGLIPGGWTPVDPGEVCAVVDADCYPVGRWPEAATIEPDTIVGAWRYACPTPDVLDAVRSGARDVRSLKVMRASGRIEQSQHRDVPNVGEGYFQLFRARPGLRFGSYPAADEYDFDFALTFPRGRLLAELSLLHLGENAKNWDGRVTPRWGSGVSA